jgi:ABC-2 type transport system permease protein
VSSDARVVDVAFSRYDGPRSGRGAAIWSLARWSSLRALGARRGWKVKVIPIALTLFAFAPAVVVLGLRALFGSSSFTEEIAKGLPYSDYSSTVAVVILAFSVVITPELVCPDRRDRTLSLYFSTAISRGDYVLGKELAALMPLLLVTLVPVLALYVGNVLFAVHPVGYVQDHAWDVPRIVVSGLIVAFYYGTVGLAISSLTARRPFAVGGYLAFLVVPAVIGSVLGNALDAPHLRLLAFAAAPIHAAEGLYPGYSDPQNIGPWLWGLTTCAIALLAVAVLAVRYLGEEE